MDKPWHNILFLDIDSICNHSKKAEMLYDEEYPDFRFVENRVPVCIDNFQALNSIVSAVENLAIVWSTDWRLFDGGEWNGWKNPLRWLEEKGGLKRYIIGSTPKKLSSDRHEEIMMWLRDEDRPIVRNFAILDDITYGMSMFGQHFFKCEYDRGLTQEIAANVAEFLSKPAIDMYNYGNKTKKETA